MHLQTLRTAYGCLLHDFGKVVYRAGGRSGTHSLSGWRELKKILPEDAWTEILDCLRWHHQKEIKTAQENHDIPPDHIAYIAYIADDLSAAADRRTIGVEGEGKRFVRHLPMWSVFTHMKKERPGWKLSGDPLDGSLRLPDPQITEIPAQVYQRAEREIKAQLEGRTPQQEWLNALLSILECWTGSLPSSTCTAESPDISLFDHLKTTAAIGSCISEYLLETGEKDFKGTLFQRETKFRKEPCFLLYSADLSGIQKFIYTVDTHQALRSLRSRSFFLGLLMEHYVDELLEGCGLSRCNLLYSGGGHCYLLLPNLPKVRDFVQAWNRKFNDFLLEAFGTSLFLGHGFTPCTGNDLQNKPAEKSPYQELFHRVSREISKHKLCRYDAKQLLKLNSAKDGETRECRICGKSDHLKDNLCPWCRCFVEISRKIQEMDLCVVGDLASPDLILPTPDGETKLRFMDEAQALPETGILRIYSKNKCCTRYSTKLLVGNYQFGGPGTTIEDLADEVQGVRRIAVCRLDVDDLGDAFVRGFENPEGNTQAEKGHFVTLSRTSAFSRQISLFFQQYINEILGPFRDREALAVSIVYSGGDDVFLVGAWNDILEAADWIQRMFAEFTCGNLTLSGGIGLFKDHYPIRLSAAYTAELEARAKAEPKKNSLCLFDAEGEHTYSWDEYRDEVVDSKKEQLRTFFQTFPEYGNSQLYPLLNLLRPMQGAEHSINLARYAYQLARMEPGNREDARWKIYRQFADRMYDWAINPKDRRQLITAIYLYVYENRGGKDV